MEGREPENRSGYGKMEYAIASATALEISKDATTGENDSGTTEATEW